MHQCYHLLLQKSENQNYHLIDYCAGIVAIRDNKCNIHSYPVNYCVTYIIFALFDDSFSSI